MFTKPEPWEEQLFADVQDRCDLLIPVSDEIAYVHYPQHCWVYNKIKICETQRIEAYPHGVQPTKYPIFSKPITNLYGMSKEARLMKCWNENVHYRPGHFWMPVLEGEQLSTDIAIINGVVFWHYSMKATKKKNGTFSSWSTCEISSALLEYITQWAQEYLPRYVGVLNFETIGDKIIECHLRMSPQWIDLYGKGWLESVIGLYRSHEWTFAGPKRCGISKVLWVAKDCYPCVLDVQKLRELEKRVMSIQLTWRERHPLSHESHDINGYRVVVVNGFDERQVNSVLEEMKEIVGERNGTGCNLLEWD